MIDNLFFMIMFLFLFYDVNHTLPYLYENKNEFYFYGNKIFDFFIKTTITIIIFLYAKIFCLWIYDSNINIIKLCDFQILNNIHKIHIFINKMITSMVVKCMNYTKYDW